MKCTHGEVVNGVRVTVLSCTCGFRLELGKRVARMGEYIKRRYWK